MQDSKLYFDPHIEIALNKALVDEKVHIQLTGFRSNQLVTVRARMQDDLRKRWESHATFKVPASGTVDLSTQKPLSGTYDDADPTGLFWSAVSTDNASYFAKTTLTPVEMTLTAEVNAEAVASAKLERLFMAANVTRTPVRDNGLVGTLFQPAGSGSYPGIIVLGGADGGLHENGAALLASHGYAALALAFFAVEHLPAQFVNIPLEYFETAIHWMQGREIVNGDKLAVIGASKGGELALLLGATFSQIKAVVSYAGSGLVHVAPGNGHSDMIWQKSSWSYRGEPLPFAPIHVTFSEAVSVGRKLLARQQFPAKPFYLKTLNDQDARNRAIIAVEKINGPVLLISGEDDQVWPSAEFSEMVINRLAEHNHPYPYKHLSYRRAGHMMCFPYEFPYMPTMFRHERQPVTGMIISCGGNSKDNAAAISDSWTKLLAFLENCIGQSRRL